MSRSPTTNEGRRSRSPIECSDRDRSKKTKATGGFRWKKGDKTAEKAESQERAEPTIRPRRVEDRTGLEERDDLSSKFGANYKTAYARPAAETKVISGTEVEGVVEKKKKPKKDKGPRPTAEPMIRVFVNDRLGTRAEIPCLASDPIKLFKAQVAQRIGRRPHEILLKRQSERPFKDHLTLEDYGIVNGVQLDLEVDTGD